MSLTNNQAEEIVPENVRDEVFKQLKSTNRNNICIDCEKKNPKWASIHLGIHLCIDCAGKHRQYGVMYSFVKSVNLDKWNRKQLMFMQKGGNQRAQQYLRKCGAISDTHKHIDYKSPILQKYKLILTAEVESELFGKPVGTNEKQVKETNKHSQEFLQEESQRKVPKQISSAEIVESEEKGKKKNKKKIAKRINLENFDAMDFDDGVPIEEKEKIVKAYENSGKIAKEESEAKTSQDITTQEEVSKLPPPPPEQQKLRELTEEESKQKLEQLKAQQNVKSISSQAFKDTSMDQAKLQQNLNKFSGSQSISSNAFFGDKQSQQDGSMAKIKDFVSDAGGKIYGKVSSYWSKS